MLDAGLEANSGCFGLVVEANARAGLATRADKWLHHMWELRCVPAANILSSAVDSLIRNGEHERAEHWVRQMRGSGVAIDTVVFSQVISARASKGDVEGAEAWMAAMSEYQLKPSAFCYNA